MSSNVVYEVRYVVADEKSDDFQSDLKKHIEVKLGLPGFISADVYAGEVLDKRKEWIAQYSVSSQKDLDDYFSEYADESKQSLEEKFGEDFTLTGRVLAPAFTKAERTCDNCGLQANYQYCANCGQRHQTQIVSLWQLFKDLLGGLFNWDSRVWRTLVPLLYKPGFLTSEYLSGKRAHYTPPLRLYLVLSIIFFLVNSNLSTNIPVEFDEEQIEIINVDENTALDVSLVEDDLSVNLPGFMNEEIWKQRRVSFLNEINTSRGQQRFIKELVNKAPVLLLILLPLITLISLLLHPLSKRYYVEHLLMLVHFHAFVFCFSLCIVAVNKFLEMFGFQRVAAWLGIYAFLLVMYYFYKMLRFTMPQSRVAAIVRVSCYGFAYIMLASFLLIVAALMTVVSF